jgi:hypothetical protein
MHFPRIAIITFLITSLFCKCIQIYLLAHCAVSSWSYRFLINPVYYPFNLRRIGPESDPVGPAKVCPPLLTIFYIFLPKFVPLYNKRFCQSCPPLAEVRPAEDIHPSPLEKKVCGRLWLQILFSTAFINFHNNACAAFRFLKGLVHRKQFQGYVEKYGRNFYFSSSQNFLF